jgi:ABC-type amino acid transport system permease subunit
LLYVELIRGVPLISLLFMASVMFLLFMPDGVNIDKLLRAQIAFVLYAGAYLAEVMRGGLQAVPRGQHEAADALGLSPGERGNSIAAERERTGLPARSVTWSRIAKTAAGLQVALPE